MQMLNALFILDTATADLVYPEQEREEVARLVRVLAPPMNVSAALRRPDLLKRADVIFSGWGAPVMDAAFLDRTPNLKLFLYAAGATGRIVTPVVAEREIAVSSAIVANSIPVAEYALATTLFSLKQGWRLSRESREQRSFVERNDAVQGAYRAKVGIVSLGVIGRLFARLLQSIDVTVLAYDPHVDAADGLSCGVSEMVTLPEIFAQCDVVSIHTPLRAETVGLIGEPLLASLRRGATLINTSRGEVIDQEAMIRVAARRADLQFVLDVATPEPPAPESPLWSLPNVLLTPHIAGSAGGECRRMGRYMVEELQRYVAGRPLKWAVAHAPVEGGRPAVALTHLIQSPASTRPVAI